MPEVNQHDWTSRYVSVACPLCTDGTRIARTALAWREHMETVHFASSSTWDDTGERAWASGPVDGLPGVLKFSHLCYGCGASFSTAAELYTHLFDVHIPTF